MQGQMATGKRWPHDSSDFYAAKKRTAGGKEIRYVTTAICSCTRPQAFRFALDRAEKTSSRVKEENGRLRSDTHIDAVRYHRGRLNDAPNDHSPPRVDGGVCHPSTPRGS